MASNTRWRSRHFSFGEGGYADTENLIRQLLQDADASVDLPPASEVADVTPTEAITPETYLSPTKEVNFGGDEKYSARTTDFTYPGDQPADSFALDGQWALEPRASGAGIRLEYRASEVQMVLAGEGEVTLKSGGKTRSFEVSGTPRSYPLVNSDGVKTGAFEMTFGPGVQAYSFTLG